MKRTVAGVAAAALCGCTTMVVPEVKEALKCEPSDAMLAACGSPSSIKDGVTFGEMIEVSGRDRDALKECALKQQALAQSIAACNERIEKYNAAIREMNARNRDAAKQ
ncbi:MAG TPA: hypothetical protein VI319_04625 [Burkholderiales bacterium]